MVMRKNPIIAIANPVDIVAEAAKAVKAAKAAAIAIHAAEIASVLVHFDTIYEVKVNRLAAFQQLCMDLDVEVGTSLTQCKKNVKKANVNIFDFVRVQQARGDLGAIRYPSKTKLRRDMQENPYRRFPLKKAKANELLKAMLIKV